MELSKLDVGSTQDELRLIDVENIRQLNDLQLAVVGGGIGDVIVG